MISTNECFLRKIVQITPSSFRILIFLQFLIYLKKYLNQYMNTLNWLQTSGKSPICVLSWHFGILHKSERKNQIHKAEQIDNERNGGLEMLKLFIDSWLKWKETQWMLKRPNYWYCYRTTYIIFLLLILFLYI